MNVTPAHVYIVRITIAWCVVFYKWLKLRDICKKNKAHYNLKEVRFEHEPNGAKSHFNIYYGKIVGTYEFNDADLELDPNLPFKMFIDWLEKEYKEG